MKKKEIPIVLIHGYAFDFRLWDAVSLVLEGREHSRLSLPGFLSPVPLESYSLESLAKSFWKSLDSLGYDDVILVGHSMGGYVAMEMIAARPDKVKGLALIHSHVFADSEEKRAKRFETLEEIKKSGPDSFVTGMISSLTGDKILNKDIIDALLLRAKNYETDTWYYGTKAMAERRDHSMTLKNFNEPVLFIMGAKDAAVPVELAYKQGALPIQGELIIYPEVGHLSMFENASLLMKDLFKFLQRL